MDFFDIKGVAERIASALGLDVRVGPRWSPRRRTAGWCPGVPLRSCMTTHVLGYVGLLSPAVAEQRGLSAADAVYVAELDLDAAEAIVSDRTTAVEPLPRFPSVARDISILVDETLQAAEVRQTIREAAPATLVRVREFDRYQGKGIPDGQGEPLAASDVPLTRPHADRR